MTTRLLFKVTNEDGSACHGGHGRWPLPTQHPDGTWAPGKALTVTGNLSPCENGLHLCRPDDLVHWLGPVIWTVQVPDGVEEVEADKKIVVRMARLEQRIVTWTERIAWHFACDCAEHVLHLTTDPRPAKAIRIARLFADGKATDLERDAAWAAAMVPTGIVARVAKRVVAWDAVRAAKRAAAWAAAGTATRVVAGTAAGVVAWDAARAAAWAATRVVAWDAVRAAAWDAERHWQTERLFHYLRGGQP